MAKIDLRREYGEIRQMLGSEKRQILSQEILKTLKLSSSYQKAKNIFVYISFKDEVETHNFINEALAEGKIVSAPALDGESMQAVQITDLAILHKDKMGILTPDKSQAKEIKPEDIDLVVVPLLAFNKQGYRLGYGKGYYDRYLAKLPAKTEKIGIAFSCQFSENLPVNLTDFPLDKIITEDGFFPISLRVETHAHSGEFSLDCHRPLEGLIDEANKKNYAYLTLTDHFDKDIIDGRVIIDESMNFNKPREGEWSLPIAQYVDFCLEKKAKLTQNPDSVQLLLGIELGFQHYLVDAYNSMIDRYPFDCVLGSIHSVNDYDFAVLGEPLYGMGKKEAYKTYLKSILDMVSSGLKINILCHFDYVTRYAPFEDPFFYYEDYPELFDQIFNEIIERQIAFEVNTRTRYQGILKDGIDTGLADINIYKRYYELGGRLISFATDSHQEGNLQMLISDSIDKLKAIGFDQAVYYINQEPHFYEI